MAKLRAIEPGSIKETVTQERIIPADDGPADDGPRDVIEYMDTVPPEEAREYLGYIYRLAPEKSDGHIGKFEIPFDLDFVRENFGGGEYKIWVKKGSHIKRTSIYKIIGAPKTEVPATTARSVGATDVRSEIVQIIQELNRSNPQGMTADLMKAAFLNALDIQKTAANNNQPLKLSELTQAMRDLHVMNNGGGSASGGFFDNPLLKDFFTALIPIGIGLISKFLTPADPLQSITQMSSLITAARQLGDGSAGSVAKEDLANVIVKNGPGLLAEGSKFLAELRAAATIRMQTQALEQSRTIPVVAANPALHTPPAPQAVPVVHAATPQPHIPTPAAASVNAAVEDGAPTPQYILRQVKGMIERGESAGFVLDYLDENLPQIIDNMRMASPEQLKEVIASDPILGSIVNHANFEKFFAEFIKLLHEKPAEVPNAPLPN